MTEEIRRLSQSLDRQIYSMHSSRASQRSSSQIKAEVTAYERFFDDTCNRLKIEQKEDKDIKDRLQLQDELAIAKRKKKLHDLHEMKEILDKQVMEKKEAKEKAKVIESSYDVDFQKVPEFVLTLYPKISTKTGLSPKKETQRKSILLKGVLESQIKEVKERLGSLDKTTRNKDKEERDIQEKQNQEIKEMEKQQKTEEVTTYKKELETQISIDSIKKEINNCIYGNSNKIAIDDQITEVKTEEEQSIIASLNNSKLDNTMERNVKVIEGYFKKNPEVPVVDNNTKKRNNNGKKHRACTSMEILPFADNSPAKTVKKQQVTSPRRNNCIFNSQKTTKIDFMNSMKKQVHDEAVKKFVNHLKVEAKKLATNKRKAKAEKEMNDYKIKEEKEQKKQLQKELDNVLKLQSNEMYF